VKVDVSISCFSADYATHVSRDLPSSYRWVGPRTPRVRTYAASFGEASDCYFSATLSGGRGRLSAVLETR
jgi:hypothetical protein